MKDLQLVEIEEIELKPVSEFPDQWRMKLAESVYQKGTETSFDDRVKIKDVIDVWDVKYFYSVCIVSQVRRPSLEVGGRRFESCHTDQFMGCIR